MAYKDIKLNCDLGEEFCNGGFSGEIDSQVMPYIDMANIACGGHVGDRRSMSKTVCLALEHNVSIGAHPSYPDRENFGRTSIKLSDEELFESLNAQVFELISVCSEYDGIVSYIKPHGALYHDCLQKTSVLDCVVKVAQKFYLPVMLLSPPKTHSRLRALNNYAKQHSVSFIWESFADRFYNDDGQLLSRTYPNAVHNDLSVILNQAKTLISGQGVSSVNDLWLDIRCDSLCVHGDTVLAFEALKSIREHLNDRKHDATKGLT